jgi:hypothetical protein
MDYDGTGRSTSTTDTSGPFKIMYGSEQSMTANAGDVNKCGEGEARELRRG